MYAQREMEAAVYRIVYLRITIRHITILNCLRFDKFYIFNAKTMGDYYKKSHYNVYGKTRKHVSRHLKILQPKYVKKIPFFRPHTFRPNNLHKH